MIVYLDNCCLQRPLDDHSQLRIAIESECVMAALQLVESNQLEIVSSEALLYEIGRNMDSLRKAFALKTLARANIFIRLTDPIEARAAQLTKYGLTGIDALHIACAEAAGAQCFCTCDDLILRNAKNIDDLSTVVVSPSQLIMELDK